MNKLTQEKKIQTAQTENIINANNNNTVQQSNEEWRIILGGFNNIWTY